MDEIAKIELLNSWNWGCCMYIQIVSWTMNILVIVIATMSTITNEWTFTTLSQPHKAWAQGQT